MKNKGLIIAIVVVVLIAIFAIGAYNGLVSSKTNVDGKLANIDTQLQRRNDLIPNLVNTVKGYATHETDVFQSVSDARSKLAGATTTAEKSEADEQLTSSLSRLLAIAENYPELKADTQFTALQDELAGTENRIAVARRDYNEAAQSYNMNIKTFPNVIFAGMFGFKEVDYFKATESATQVPTVDFNK